ncbi:MAG: cation diffusion facilitator family transporter [Bacteroidales bacterium]|nr:cation diffusion facilitator family transporter [Bacteroidales bacterium]
MNTKVKTAGLSIVSNSLLIMMKVTVGIISGSVSIISEAIHSAMDLVAALIAFMAVRISDVPPDSKHPYGHGKAENISGVIEALLIFGAAALIIIEAIKKLLGEEIVLEKLWIGVAVMAISAIVNWFVSRKLYKTARETDSVALEADALHLKTDVYTSAGVAAGLLLILLTDIKWLDPAVALAVAFLIIRESWELLRRAFWPLMDSSWSKEEVGKLENRLTEMGVTYHDLRTRKAGNYRIIDIHVEVPENESVGSAHRYCDKIEEKLKTEFNHLNVTIHVEPI